VARLPPVFRVFDSTDRSSAHMFRRSVPTLLTAAWPRHCLLSRAHRVHSLVPTIVATVLPALTLNTIDTEEGTVEALRSVLCLFLAAVKTTGTDILVATSFFLTHRQKCRRSRSGCLARACYKSGRRSRRCRYAVVPLDTVGVIRGEFAAISQTWVLFQALGCTWRFIKFGSIRMTSTAHL
jgi:hypothetical protein